MTKNKNKKSSEAAKQEAFKLSDGICYCKTPEGYAICMEKIYFFFERYLQFSIYLILYKKAYTFSIIIRF